jgi:hypothetical protein
MNLLVTAAAAAESSVALPRDSHAAPALVDLGRAPTGWFALDVTRREKRKWDWVALIVDVHPDDYKPDGSRAAHEAWVRIPGKYSNRNAAWDALEDIMATRH